MNNQEVLNAGEGFAEFFLQPQCFKITKMVWGTVIPQ